MSTVIALLGHTKKPTCGVEDYCAFLGRAMTELGIQMEPVRVEWKERGWGRALLQLWKDAAPWRGKWALMQYTAGAWSRFGFPFGALAAVSALRFRGVRCAVMFHEPYRWQGESSGWIGRFRGASQDWVVQKLYLSADRSVFADPLDAVHWLPEHRRKAAFIPIGGNVPEPKASSRFDIPKRSGQKTVAVYCLSDPPNLGRELEDIFHAMRLVSAGGSRPRLVLLGRGTSEADSQIQRMFGDIPIDVVNLGIRSAEEVSQVLAEADAMLCVRGRLFPRRGSALAGIACGVPVIAYAGPAQETPIAEAGVEFVSYGDRAALAATLVRVLTDDCLQRELRAKNQRAQERYFSWSGIAKRYVDFLSLGGEMSRGHRDPNRSQRRTTAKLTAQSGAERVDSDRQSADRLFAAKSICES
jgi:glycosyltransferase involved in cell wall biosynthesis